jgi:C4-dicarboxylate-specific signal transduction histidine kinase
VPNNDSNRLERWVWNYLQANAGSLLPGMVHNHQNAVHSLSMQTEMLSAELNASRTHKALNRLATLSRKLIQDYDQLGKRELFTQQSPTQVHMGQFAHWLAHFWTNNLFVKHHVQLNIEVGPDTPQSVYLCPYRLTLCVEEALKNALEGCAQQTSHERHQLWLTISRDASAISLVLVSPTSLAEGLDPFAEFSTTKEQHLGLGLALARHCSSQSGWSVSLTPDKGRAAFQLTIPLP